MSTDCYDLIHMDLLGPYKKTTSDGNKYFLTIVDDFSRMTWVFLLKLKSDVKTQHDKTVIMVRIDNGTEFINSVCNHLFRTMGIIHQRTCAYTPQQNGVAERKHRYILKVTRAIKFKAKIPIKF